MEYLFAPWREKYFSSQKKGCIFCGKEIKKLLFYEGKFCSAALNLFPYTSAHAMVFPKAHKGKLSLLTKDELLEMMEIAVKVSESFKKLFGCEGINFGINQGSCAGAGFTGHIHLHVVGRWKGDVNFMTSAGNVRVVSVDTEKNLAKLRKFFKNKKCR